MRSFLIVLPAWKPVNEEIGPLWWIKKAEITKAGNWVSAVVCQTALTTFIGLALSYSWCPSSLFIYSLRLISLLIFDHWRPPRSTTTVGRASFSFLIPCILFHTLFPLFLFNPVFSFIRLFSWRRTLTVKFGSSAKQFPSIRAKDGNSHRS